MRRLVDIQYERNEVNLTGGSSGSRATLSESSLVRGDSGTGGVLRDEVERILRMTR